MTQHWTDFREYRRGRVPADWTELWTTGSDARVEGAACDLAHRNVILAGASPSGARTALSWNAPSADTGIANQEILARLRVLRAVNRNLFLLRASGTVGTDNAYRAVLDFSTGGGISIGKLVAGVNTILGNAAMTLALGAFYWVRFRANGTTISLRMWIDGETEPGTWAVSVTDSSLATGITGMQSALTAEYEVSYFSVGTNGDSAPSEDLVTHPPMDQWCLLPDEEVEFTAEVEHYDPSDDTVGRSWFSTHGRSQGPTDYPPASEVASMEGLLADPGDTGSSLSGDTQFGGVVLPSVQQIVLRNNPAAPDANGPLDSWLDLSFAGRPVCIRAGRRWLTKPTPTSDGVLNPHRRFEILYSALSSTEPNIGHETNEDGSTVTIPLSQPSQSLAQTVPVRRNVGIPTGVKALTTHANGRITIPHHASYNRTGYVRMVRFLIPTGGIAGTSASVIDQRGTGTSRQWSLLIGQASHATVANRLVLQVDASDTTTLINQAALPTSYTPDSLFHDVIIGVDGSSGSGRWYWLLDTRRVGGGALTKNPANPTATTNLANAPGIVVFDVRLDVFLPENEALARFSALFDTDPSNLAMHRCDDNAGAVVTDYSSTANHGALVGTINVDYQWEPTYSGTAESAGTPQPMASGAIFHAPTQSIDPNTELFRFNDRAIDPSVTVGVRAKGLSLNTPASYTSPAGGVIDIVGAADEPISFGQSATDAPPSKSVHIPQLIKEDLQARGSLTYANADLDSFLALRVFLPMEGGYYYSDPPTVADLIGLLGRVGAHSRLDSSGRAAVATLPLPINPSPFTSSSAPSHLLEFLGYPNRGVTLGWHSSYALNQSTSWSVVAVFKLSSTPLDNSTSSFFTYFPTGQTIADLVLGAAGFYLGIDGRDGCLVYGSPGVTNTAGTGTGLHYTKVAEPLVANTWYVIHGVTNLSSNNRSLDVGLFDSGFTLYSVSNSTTGTMTTPTGAPLRIGHGPQGSFAGCISYVIGSSLARVSVSGEQAGQAPTGAAANDRFHVALTDGQGDTAIELVQSRYARVEGARWCPKLMMNFSATAEPSISGLRSVNPAWRADARHRLNYLRLTGSDVASGVTPADRASLGKPYVSGFSSDASILSDHPRSLDIPLDTPLYHTPDALVVARQIRDRLSPSRDYIDVEDWRNSALRLQLTDEVALYHPRWLPDWRYMRVYSLLSHLRSLGFDIGNFG